MCGTENPSSKPTSICKCSLSSQRNAAQQHSLSSKDDIVINLEQGDPTVYESYWGAKKMSEKCTVVIKGSELMSYISDMSKACWFMEAEFEAAIRRLHRITGNAAVDGRHVVVGTGSTQLYLATLYALTSPAADNPVPVVCAAPYYSQYPEETDFLRSGLYKWGGDANGFEKEGPYIEVVTSPNNPDGHIRQSVVKSQYGDQGKLIYDLAYYWPQYTPITRAADNDIMCFTFSKATGHAGSRIGWAIVKDEEIARKMTKFIEMSSIGVSKDSQIRAAKIMGVICDGYQDYKHENLTNFFEFSYDLMAGRWKKLREVITRNGVFTLPKYPRKYCLFHGEVTEAHPAFAWLKVKDGIQDCEKFLKEHKIGGRGGKRFGADPSFARVSMLSRDGEFEQFLERLARIKVEGRQ